MRSLEASILDGEWHLLKSIHPSMGTLASAEKFIHPKKHCTEISMDRPIELTRDK